MPTASDRRPPVVGLGWLFGVLLAVVLLWLGEMAAPPWGTPSLAAPLQAAEVPAFGLVIGLVIAAGLILTVRARYQDRLPRVSAEEPLLRHSQLPACQSRSPVVGVAGLEPASGVSGLTFNLGILLATAGMLSHEGSKARPRPVCLLSEGSLTSRLGLGANALEDYLGEHPYRVTPELLNLATRHPSGCELFCLRRNGRGPEFLSLLLPQLQRRYDAVVVDCGCGDRNLIDAIAERSDALLLVATPSAGSAEAAGFWAERTWSLALEKKTAVVVNRMRARPLPRSELSAGFLYQAQLPEDSRIGVLEEKALPWALDHRLAAARRLVEIAQQLFPALMKEAVAHAS